MMAIRSPLDQISWRFDLQGSNEAYLTKPYENRLAAGPTFSDEPGVASEEVKAGPFVLSDHRSVFKIVCNPVPHRGNPHIAQETPRGPVRIKALGVCCAHLLPARNAPLLVKLADGR